MSKTILFHIERLGYFKTLGPIIDEALRRGHKVGILYNSSIEGHNKGIPVPKPDLFPLFEYGKPVNVPYNGKSDFANTVQKAGHVLVLHMGYVERDFNNYVELMDDEQSYPFQYNVLKKNRFPLISIASHFYDHCLWPLEVFDLFDKYCVLSPFSIDAHKKILEKEYIRQNRDIDVLDNDFKTIYADKVAVTGSTIFDPFRTVYAEKKQNNADSVLFYMPKIDDHPFMKIFMKKQNMLKSIMYSIVLEQAKYFKNVFSYIRLEMFLEKLDILLKESKLGLIVKSRPKHNDDCFRDWIDAHSTETHWGENENFYPNIVSEIVRRVFFSIHIRSFSVLESVVSGVPAINFQVPIIYDKNTSKEQDFINIVRSHKQNSMFNYEGCVWNYPWADQDRFFCDFNKSKLIQDDAKRAAYINYYCGIQDERSAAEKQIDVISEYI